MDNTSHSFGIVDNAIYTYTKECSYAITIIHSLNSDYDYDRGDDHENLVMLMIKNATQYIRQMLIEVMMMLMIMMGEMT